MKYSRLPNDLGYVSKDERFRIEKTSGRAYTRGPFRNWWTVIDTKTGDGHRDLPSLAEAKAWIEARASLPLPAESLFRQALTKIARLEKSHDGPGGSYELSVAVKLAKQALADSTR